MTAPDPNSPWSLVTGAAAYTGYHPHTLRAALERGDLHGHQRRFRGHWRIHLDSLNAWLAGENSAAACACSELAQRRPASRRSA